MSISSIGRAVRRRIETSVLVLMYHRVATVASDPWQLCVSRERFAEQLEVLKHRTSVIRLDEVADRLGARERGRLVAVTFDDGYADNLHAALPELTRAGLPATVFVATGWIGRPGPFWWDVLADAIFSAPGLPLDLDLRAGADSFHWAARRTRVTSTQDRLQRNDLHLRLWRWLRLLRDNDRADALGQLQAWTGHRVSIEHLGRPMTEPEVSELNRSCLVEVAAHARTHRALTTLPLDQRWSEIEGSMQDCERLLGARPSDFAYPHGDHDSATVAMVERAGFSRACIADHGLTWPRTAPFRMPRFAVPDIGGEDFERKLLSDWLP